MGFMPTPAPYYPEQPYYQYSPSPDYRQMYTPSPGGDSPYYPPQAPLGYFAPPRPAQKVQIRAPDAPRSPQHAQYGNVPYEQQQYNPGQWYGPPAF